MSEVPRFHLTQFAPALAKVREAPATLSDSELAILAEFGDKDLVTRATAARATALQPPTPAAPVRTKRAEPTVPPVPPETVDQFLERLGVAPVSTDGVTYDGARFDEAHTRYWVDPASMTLDDIKQFAIVDPQLGQIARAKQLGWVRAEAEDEETKQLFACKVSHKFFGHWMRDYFTPLLATYRYKQRVAQTELATLQQRCVMLEVATEQQRQALDRLERRTLELEVAAAVTR